MNHYLTTTTSTTFFFFFQKKKKKKLLFIYKLYTLLCIYIYNNLINLHVKKKILVYEYEIHLL